MRESSLAVYKAARRMIFATNFCRVRDKVWEAGRGCFLTLGPHLMALGRLLGTVGGTPTDATHRVALPFSTFRNCKAVDAWHKTWRPMTGETESPRGARPQVRRCLPTRPASSLPRWRFFVGGLALWTVLAGPSWGWASDGGWRTGPEGIVYRNDRVPDVPWSIHIVKIDRSRSDFKLVTTLAQGRFIGLGPLTSQIELLPPDLGRPLAAINGDFYKTEQEAYAGDPRGLQIASGELVSAPTGGTCFWIDAAGNPQMAEVASRFRVTWPDGTSTPVGLNEERTWRAAVLYTARLGFATGTGGGREIVLVREGTNSWLPLQPGKLYTARVREVRETGNTRLSQSILVVSLSPEIAAKAAGVKPGDLLKISTATAPDLSGVLTAIGGGPGLVRQGKAQSTHVNKANEWHPRSALGWNNTHFFFVVVDGRQRGLSVGMRLPDLASYLEKLGCTEAMNLDGGASAEVWMAGRIMNSPCFGVERRIGNALVVVQKKSSDPATPTVR